MRRGCATRVALSISHALFQSIRLTPAPKPERVPERREILLRVLPWLYVVQTSVHHTTHRPENRRKSTPMTRHDLRGPKGISANVQFLKPRRAVDKHFFANLSRHSFRVAVGLSPKISTCSLMPLQRSPRSSSLCLWMLSPWTPLESALGQWMTFTSCNPTFFHMGED